MTAFLALLLVLGLASGPGAQSAPVSMGTLESQHGQQSVASDLTFQPDRPTAGATVQVTYSPLSELASRPVLHLRARLRTPEDDSYNQGMGSETIAVLERGEDGRFRGSFHLPPEVVFVALAVEEPDATQVDGREGLFWELLVHDQRGRPLFEALAQRFNDHMGRDEPGVLDSARELARLYPDRPNSWTLLSAAEGWFLGEEGAAEREAVHQERREEFDRVFRRRQDLTADEVGYLYWYARGELREYWRERLLRDFPNHFFAVQERAMSLRQDNPEDPQAVLDGVEEIWSEDLDREARLRALRVGVAAASQAEDDQSLRLWASRWEEVDPLGRANAALLLTSVEGTRSEGLALLSEFIRRTEAAEDADRPLGKTAVTHRRDSLQRGATLRRYLGEALVQAGRIQEGVRALEEVADREWNPGVLRSLGDAYLSLADTASAARYLAALAADPATSTLTADSLRQRVGSAAPGWDLAVEEARSAMIRQTLESSGHDRMPQVRLLGPEGAEVALRDRLGDRATVLVIWSRYCGYSNEAMPRIVTLTRELGKQRVPFLAVTRDGVEEAQAYLEEEGLEVRALFDVWGEAGRALNAWGTPQYFVLDGDGRLRFPFTSLDAIPRQVLALSRSAGGG